MPAQSVDVEEVPHRLDEDSCTTVDLPAASPNSAQPQVEEEEEEAKASLIGNPLTHSTGMEKASTDGPNHPGMANLLLSLFPSISLALKI